MYGFEKDLLQINMDLQEMKINFKLIFGCPYKDWNVLHHKVISDFAFTVASLINHF